jgi:hypothetical protein
MNVFIQLTVSDEDNVGPFNLYSSADFFGVPFATGVPLSALLEGQYYSVSDFAITVRICSVNPVGCYNVCQDISISEFVPTTTTTSTTIPPTTTSTTTVQPISFTTTFVCPLDEGIDIYIDLFDISGGVSPYYVGLTTFASESAALANTNWLLTNTFFYAVDPTMDATYWVVVKDSADNIFAQSITTGCYTTTTTTTV